MIVVIAFLRAFPILPVGRQKWCSPEKARHFARGGFDGTNGFSDLVGSVTNDKRKEISCQRRLSAA